MCGVAEARQARARKSLNLSSHNGLNVYINFDRFERLFAKAAK